MDRRAKRLEKLIQHRKMAEKKMGGALAECCQRFREVEAQLEQLGDYRANYLSDLEIQGRQGIAHYHLQNQRRFLENVDRVQEQQQGLRERYQEEIRGLQKEITILHQKSEALCRALEHLLAEKALSDHRREQKESDEVAQNYFRLRHPKGSSA